MTYEEAIKTLKEETGHIKNMIYPQDMETTIWVSNRIEAINMAIHALEAQIPKPFESNFLDLDWCNE